MIILSFFWKFLRRELETCVQVEKYFQPNKIIFLIFAFDLDK